MKDTDISGYIQEFQNVLSNTNILDTLSKIEEDVSAEAEAVLVKGRELKHLMIVSAIMGYTGILKIDIKKDSETLDAELKEVINKLYNCQSKLSEINRLREKFSKQ